MFVVWLKEEERKKMEEDERTRMEECIAGSLVGLAVGDALGAPVEGRSGDEVAIILTGGHAPLRPAMAVDHWDEHCVRAACDAKKAHPHGEEGVECGWDYRPNMYGVQGIYTDDTQYCLCGLQSIFETGHFDPQRTTEVFSRLRMSKGSVTGKSFGLFRGTGQSGRKAITRMVNGEDWHATGQFTAGNGAAMRVGPLGAFYYADIDKLLVNTIESCLLTTRDPRGIAAGLAIAIACAFFVGRAAGQSHVVDKPSATRCSEIDSHGSDDSDADDDSDGDDDNDDDDDFDAKHFIGFVAEHCRRGEALMLENYGRHLLFPAKTELDTSASGSTAHKQQPAARRGGGKGKVKKGRQREMERGKRAKGEKRRPPAKDTSLTNKPHDRRSPDLDCVHQFSQAVKQLASLVNRSLDRAGIDIMKRAQKLSSRKVTHPCQGFAFCSVLMSLLAVASASSFEEAVVAAISMGGDCDTVGAMVGTMGGSRWGLSAIPKRWRKGVANSEALQARGLHLGQLATGRLSVQPIEEDLSAPIGEQCHVDESSSNSEEDEDSDHELDAIRREENGGRSEDEEDAGRGSNKAAVTCCCPHHSLAQLVEMERNPTWRVHE